MNLCIICSNGFKELSPQSELVELDARLFVDCNVICLSELRMDRFEFSDLPSRGKGAESSSKRKRDDEEESNNNSDIQRIDVDLKK